MYTMCEFDGKILGLQNIAVDNFSDTECTTFFLSHCHTDHMKNLRSNEFINYLQNNEDCYLYCSSITKLIVSTFNGFEGLDHKIKDITLMTTITVKGSDKYPYSYKVHVTPIPAGHCPGSVMYLFETSSQRILFTGDFAISVGKTKKIKPFHFASEVKPINCIYLDVTFLSKNYWKFTSRNSSILLILKEIELWLQKSDSAVVLKFPAKYGGEAIIQEVAKTFSCAIHVPDEIYDLYLSVPEMAEVLTNDCSSTRIHSCCKSGNLISCQGLPNDVLTILPTAQFFHCKVNEKPNAYKWITKKLLRVNYSSHCSGEEIQDFLTYLKPKKVVAFTSVVGKTDTERDKLLESIMSQNVEEVEEEEEVPYPARKRVCRFSSKKLKLLPSTSSYLSFDTDF